ncbi:choice-of-anchor D domain-containing protein [Jatrophihabitans sp. YIM 134969]
MVSAVPRSRARTALLAVAATVAAVLAGVLVDPSTARADDTTVSQDTLRTGWDRAEPALAPANVGASDFGRLFATHLDGQVYAQPIVANGTVLAATENDKVYGLDPETGAIRWTRDVGPAWPAAAIGCGDLVPNIGVTSTPVYDAATGTAYFTAKVDDGPDDSQPHWYMHAVDITTGVERAGFPTTIAGAPSNDPANAFNPFTAMQRPGLLLMDGVVYAGFASHCDAGPYVGYVVGVNAATGGVKTMWSTEAGSSNALAGIWQSGGGLVSDGPGRIIVATGNGVSPAPGPGHTPPATLAESVIRLQVGTDGSLSAVDYFSPTDNTNLDRDDTDLGSGGPLAIPDGYGTAAHPHLLVEVGKDGRVFLLDRDDLGGTGQGPGGTDAVLQTGGPFNGVWGHPAFWGGDSGYVYTVENSGPMRAFKVGVAGNGLPALTSVGTTSSTWGYTSGSPVVTSVDSTPGSALVWSVFSSGSNGANGQLRAYDAVPTGGVLKLRFSAPIGTAAKFQVPATSDGRVYVGNRDGVLFGFGRPAAGALTGTATDLGQVRVGKPSTATATVTATKAVTVTAVAADAPFSVDAPTLPVTLQAGQQLPVTVHFTPSTWGAASGALTFTTADAGSFAFDLHGTGVRPGLGASPSSLDFGEVPVGGRSTRNVNVVNTGRTDETITAVSGPTGSFSSTGLPSVGTPLAPGASVSIPVTFGPRRTGALSSSIVVTSDQGRVTVSLSGTGVQGAPHLTIAPTTLAFGKVSVGSSRTASFDITNTGNLTLTLTKAAPPPAPFGTSTPVSEGQQLAPGDTVHQSVTFAPTATGSFTGKYVVTGNDGQGAQQVVVTGRGGPPLVTVPGPAAGGWQANGAATQSGGDTVLTPAESSLAGDVVLPTPLTPAGLHVRFTAEISGGGGADGMTFALLDAATSTASSIGNSGGALGFAGLTGYAVTLDTYQNGSDISDNFTGIARSGPDTVSDEVTYLKQKQVPTPLTAGTHTVDVTVAAAALTVAVDGTVSYSAPVTLPDRVLLAFTAGTGGLTDQHVVRDVVITRPAARGPVLGAGGACLTVGTGSPRPAVLAACSGASTQKWVVQANGTLTSSGQCLDLPTPGAGPVDAVACSGGAGQVWQARPNRTVRNPASGLCLATAGGGTADGVRVVAAVCNARKPTQQWQLPS